MTKSLFSIGLLLLIMGITLAIFGETSRLQLIAGGLTSVGVIVTFVGFTLRRNAKTSS